MHARWSNLLGHGETVFVAFIPTSIEAGVIWGKATIGGHFALKIRVFGLWVTAQLPIDDKNDNAHKKKRSSGPDCNGDLFSSSWN